jgi:hypothetical protein
MFYRILIVKGFFKVEKLPGDEYHESYTGTTANGITTSDYSRYRGVSLTPCDGNPFPGCDGVRQSGTLGTGAEEVFTCVQCGQRYIEIENDILANACCFHSEAKFKYE